MGFAIAHALVAQSIPSVHPIRQSLASIAGTIMELGNLGGAAIAVVAEGAPVAAADRPVFAGAHLRCPYAGAIDVGRVAEADAVVAEQALTAREANDGAADRPFATAASWRFVAARMGRNGRGCRKSEGDNEGGEN